MCERKGRLVKARLGRRPKAYSQAERLARMIRALSSRSMSINDLSGEFGVSRRQIYRDIDRIQEEGHPLEQSDGGGEKSWQLPLGYKGLPPITVTPYELMALHLAKAHVAYLAGTPFVENLDGLIAKVQAGLPHRVANHLARINDVFLPRQAPVRRSVQRGAHSSPQTSSLVGSQTSGQTHQSQQCVRRQTGEEPGPDAKGPAHTDRPDETPTDKDPHHVRPVPHSPA